MNWFVSTFLKLWIGFYFHIYSNQSVLRGDLISTIRMKTFNTFFGSGFLENLSDCGAYWGRSEPHTLKIFLKYLEKK